MDLNLNQSSYNATQTAPQDARPSGNWVPIDTSTLGFTLQGQPNQVVQGPDGFMYRIGGAPQDPQSVGLPASAANAIPTPPSIVQMPPIVQPIALVPFTSLNQPLLQYDPYSRPQEPKNEVVTPTYVMKPYRQVSFISLCLALVGAIVLLLSLVATFTAVGARPAFNFGAIDSAKALLASFGIGDSSGSQYFKYILEPNKSSDTMTVVVSYALPALVLVAAIIFIVLVFKYLVKFGQRKTPRSFSVLALINVIICIAIAVMLYSISNGEVAESAKAGNLSAFFSFKSTILPGIGLIVALVLAIALIIVPLCAKKNAYMLEETSGAESYQPYVMNR
ncbi:MAG: hypothetical protein LBE09_08525 [Christensenellaceae bacterium]|jgi:hypothetical protein|nr:hypothetical protein [Christensenellaceae bacterium]